MAASDADPTEAELEQLVAASDNSTGTSVRNVLAGLFGSVFGESHTPPPQPAESALSPPPSPPPTNSNIGVADAIVHDAEAGGEGNGGAEEEEVRGVSLEGGGLSGSEDESVGEGQEEGGGPTDVWSGGVEESGGDNAEVSVGTDVVESGGAHTEVSGGIPPYVATAETPQKPCGSAPGGSAPRVIAASGGGVEGAEEASAGTSADTEVEDHAGERIGTGSRGGREGGGTSPDSEAAIAEGTEETEGFQRMLDQYAARMAAEEDEEGAERYDRTLFDDEDQEEDVEEASLANAPHLTGSPLCMSQHHHFISYVATFLSGGCCMFSASLRSC